MDHHDSHDHQSRELSGHAGHVNHCFDYLRQSIMCAGDMTIEWARDRHGVRTDVDGWNIPHQCKNWQEMIDFTLQHKAPSNKTGIV